MEIAAAGNTQLSAADLAMNMSQDASISATVSSTLESSSFDGMDMMMANMDSSMSSEQMMQMAIALIILQMINGGSGATGSESGTDLLGMLAADSLLQSASSGEATLNATSQTSITMQQTASVSYASNAYASQSTETVDPNQQLNNVDVLI